MFKCYNQSKIENDLLKCDQCSLPFDEYCEPKFLPCFKTICTKCVSKIGKEAINKCFKCEICSRDHNIPDGGFTLNEKIYNLLTCEQMEISRGREYEQLQNNLGKIETFSSRLRFDSDYSKDVIREHCNEQIRLVQLSTENKIEQINKINEVLIKFFKNYEIKCIQSSSKNSDFIKEITNKLFNNIECFLKEKKHYLKQYKTDDEETKMFNKISEELQIELEKENKKLTSFIFGNELIKFKSNSNEINEYELGTIDYNNLNDPLKLISASGDFTIKLWDIDSNRCIKTLNGTSSPVLCVKKTLGNKIISSYWDGSIKIWNIETGDCLKTINVHSEPVYGIQLVSYEKFVSCSADKTIKLFDLNTYSCIKTLFGHTDKVCSIDKISNDKIVSSSWDTTIRIWSLNSGECLKVFEGHSSSVTCVKALSDELIISGSFNEIKIWNMETVCLQTLNGHSDFVNCILKLSNEQIASCSSDKTIKIWNFRNGECLKTIEAHLGPIYSLKGLPNQKIISCSADETIKIWDFEKDIVKSFKGHSNAITCLELLN